MISARKIIVMISFLLLFLARPILRLDIVNRIYRPARVRGYNCAGFLNHEYIGLDKGRR